MYVRHFFKCSFLLLFVAFSLLTCSFFFFCLFFSCSTFGARLTCATQISFSPAFSISTFHTSFLYYFFFFEVPYDFFRLHFFSFCKCVGFVVVHFS